MHVRIMLYAHLADRLGHERRLDLPSGSTGRDAVTELAKDTGLGNIPGYCRLAVNSRFVDWDAPLADGDRIAIMPPVSGA
jgi:molybdopterin converting factor small subunit